MKVDKLSLAGGFLLGGCSALLFCLRLGLSPGPPNIFLRAEPKPFSAAAEPPAVIARSLPASAAGQCTPIASTAVAFENALGKDFTIASIPDEANGHGVIAASCKPKWNYLINYPKYDTRGPGWLQAAFRTVSAGAPAPECGYGWDPHIHEAFPKGDCGLIVDVGANIGLSVGPPASLGWRIIAFEPIPNNVHLLHTNFHINGWYADKIGLIHGAASDKTGEATIYAPVGREDNTAMSSTAATRNVGGTAKEFKIKTISLDDYFAGASPNLVNDIRVIKVDTQGHELNVLQGARKLLSTGQRQYVIEVELDAGLQKAAGNSIEDILKFMKSVGWNCFCDAAGKRPYTPGCCYDCVFRLA